MDLKDTVNVVSRNIDRGITNVVSTAMGIAEKAAEMNGGSWGYKTMLMTPIEDYCLVDMADWKMRRSLFMSMVERNTTLDMIADSVSGTSRKVSDEVYKYEYSYTDGNNYLEEYQRNADIGTTRKTEIDVISHNSEYGKNRNLYPDDNDSGEDKFYDNDKWSVEPSNSNRNSILHKTKELFRCRKINTIISRFHTEDNNGGLYDERDVKTSYGISHGRNLLTYDAEHGQKYSTNGYDNPYCRVWTHHHQYAEKRARLMRPFSVENENKGENVNNSNVHEWGDGFKEVTYRKTETLMKDENGKTIEQNKKDVTWGWKNNRSRDWEKTVFDKDTGLVNIAPKFLGGAEKNIHTKDCMFSIENLAWQGYDPYSFERALSWEQRGPFGGRIMWFPPYGLRFNEDASVNWNEHSFIGRGENVYTYANTSRSGTLEFMMVVDHPSILDYATWYGKSQPGQLPKDTDVYRFFAGCDSLTSGSGSGSSTNGNGSQANGGNGGGSGNGSLLSYVKPTPLTDEYVKKDITDGETVKVTENKKPEPKEEPKKENPMPDEEVEVSFYAFFPNNYSGYYDRLNSSKVDPVAYLLYGKGAQWRCDEDDVNMSESLPIDFYDTSNSDFTGKGYEMKSSGTYSTQDTEKNYIIGTGYPGSYGKNKYIPTKNKKWYYRIDGEYAGGITYTSVKNTFGQTLRTPKSYKDLKTLCLNGDIASVKTYIPNEKGNDNLYTLSEVAYALKHIYDSESNTETKDQERIHDNSRNWNEERINKLIEIFDTRDSSMYSAVEISGIGYSNSHGSNPNGTVNQQRNYFLAKERCNTIINWFMLNYGHGSVSIKGGEIDVSDGRKVNKSDENNESGDSAKIWRSAKITVKFKKSSVKELKDLNQTVEEETTSANEAKPYRRFDDFVEVEKSGNVQLYKAVNVTDDDKKDRRWFYDKETGEMKLWKPEYIGLGRWGDYAWDSEKVKVDMDNTPNNATKNSLRYDQEYHFFKKLEAEHKDVFDSLVEKLQYFDPAFHAMTPEGFMGRLNFLHQCTRQGDTIAASDKNGHSANNLAFGRPPFCILRLGDFYYQKIVINNINISYDPLTLDLNNEGVGVVPLIANVTISFKFIGGGDLSGPVRRLQNAMSFNYYANGRLYDNRADRVERQDTDWQTMGAMGNDKVNFDSSYFHHVRMADNN